MNKPSVVLVAAFAALLVCITEFVIAADSGENNSGVLACQLQSNSTKASDKNGNGVYKWWRGERARRQAEIDQYLADYQLEFDSFRTAPLAIRQDPLNFVGIQMIIFRLLTELFPDIWGPAGDKMAIVGYGPDPWDPETVMPLGTGYILSEGFTPPFGDTGSIQVNYATFTCMGCHSGSVTLEDGTLHRMVGGSNPTENYFDLINRTVTDPRYTPENFKAALNSKPLGFVYENPALLPQEIFERELFNAPGGAEFFLGELELVSKESVKLLTDTLFDITYDGGINSPALSIIGMLDAFGANAASFTDPNSPVSQLEEELPPLPAPTDFPAAWQLQDRPRFEWGNEVGTVIYRSVAAALSLTAGDPPAVNEQNVLEASDFAEFLPSAPYPFDVNRPMAARGSQIYRQACAGCHEAGNTIIQSPAETGTDPGRAMVFTEFSTEMVRKALREGCTELPQCFQPDGTPYTDSEILEPTLGYTPLPLHGIWQTAPYLHNGSVPTLYHLLTGERPAMFYRGNTTYDQELVGYTWVSDTTSNGRAYYYDTSLKGFSNAGHSGPEFNGGIDWDDDPQMLWDLLEYLKTL